MPNALSTSRRGYRAEQCNPMSKEDKGRSVNSGKKAGDMSTKPQTEGITEERKPPWPKYPLCATCAHIWAFHEEARCWCVGTDGWCFCAGYVPLDATADAEVRAS